MKFIYDVAVKAVNGVLKLYSAMPGNGARRKFSRFVKGRRNLISKIAEEMEADGRSLPVVWFHAASLGEFGIARPLIARLKESGECNVVMTFFSPSGYEPVSRNHPTIDHLFYLPLDTPANAAAFLDAVKPSAAVFMVSEYWPNILMELQRRAIPTYLVSAIIRDDSPFFKWYGSVFRKALPAYSRFFVLDEHSKENLAKLGYENVSLSRDPLFDNAELVANTPWSDPLVERFKNGRKLFIAGSISDERDLKLVSSLANSHPDTRFLFVPHDVSPETVARIKASLKGECKAYSECDETTALSSTQVMVIDFVGALAYLYRYADWAYVGGGFTPLLHSVIEPVVYGIPVSFGPRIHRKVTPRQLIDLGIGAMVTSPEELDAWFRTLCNDDERLARIREKAASYVGKYADATSSILEPIKRDLWATK